MGSSRKFLIDGTLNPAYKADRHKKPGDRHTDPSYNKTDRHIEKDRHPSKFEAGFFIAWDGEGITPGTTKRERYQDTNGNAVSIYHHTYNYLASSQGHELLNLKRTLHTKECIELLLGASTEYPQAIHVIFSGSYDVNMLLVDVDKALLEVLHDGDDIDWEGYVIKYVPRKELSIRKKATPPYIKRGEKWVAQYESKITLWDVFGFFQGSFVSALKAYNFPQEELDYIAGMKKERGTFTKEAFERDVIPYCQAELRLLKALMNKLKGYLIEAQLPIKRWDGAGAVAASLLKREGVKQFKGDIPPAVNIASQYAYSGGRIECLQYGHYAPLYDKDTAEEDRPGVHHYDIRSAYPAAMLRCLAMHNGRWEHITDVPPRSFVQDRLERSDFNVWEVQYSFPKDMILYPFSNRDVHGQISYPSQGHTWVWGPELLAALETIPQPEKYITLLQGWDYVTLEPVYPFSFLPNLFALRAKWKQEGNGAEKVLKLGINSLYGKTIQKQGFHVDIPPGITTEERVKLIAEHIPPFFQLQWAGYITSHTRAKLYRAAMQKPQAIIALATDGIFSTEALQLPCENVLGNWEYSFHTDMTIVQSGVYWYTNPDGKEKSYYRGFDPDTISREKVLEGWANHEHSLPTTSTRFITLGSALVSDDRFKLWRSWYTMQRELALDFMGANKRKEKLDLGIVTLSERDPSIDYLWGRGSPANGLYRTYPTMGLPGMSEPYALPWETVYQDMIDGIPVAIYLQEMMDSYA